MLDFMHASFLHAFFEAAAHTPQQGTEVRVIPAIFFGDQGPLIDPTLGAKQPKHVVSKPATEQTYAKHVRVESYTFGSKVCAALIRSLGLSNTSPSLLRHSAPLYCRRLQHRYSCLSLREFITLTSSSPPPRARRHAPSARTRSPSCSRWRACRRWTSWLQLRQQATSLRCVERSRQAFPIS